MRDATPRVTGTALKPRLQPTFTVIIAKPGKIPTSQQRPCTNSLGKAIPSHLFCSGPARRLPQAVELEAKGTCPHCNGTGGQGCGQGCGQRCGQGSTHSPHPIRLCLFIAWLCSQQTPAPSSPPRSSASFSATSKSCPKPRFSIPPPYDAAPPLPAKDGPSRSLPCCPAVLSPCGRGLPLPAFPSISHACFSSRSPS